MAQAYVFAGQYDQVLRFVQAAQKTNHEALVISQVLEACIDIDDNDHPLELMALIEMLVNQISVLPNPIKKPLAIGRQATAGELLERAAAIAKTIVDRNPGVFTTDIIDSMRAKSDR